MWPTNGAVSLSTSVGRLAAAAVAQPLGVRQAAQATGQQHERVPRLDQRQHQVGEGRLRVRRPHVSSTSLGGQRLERIGGGGGERRHGLAAGAAQPELGRSHGAAPGS